MENLPQDGVVHSLFEKYASHYPDHIAVSDHRSFTYRELNQKANQLAHYLQNFVKRNALIVIAMSRSIEWLIGVMGILKAGCAYVPIDETYPTENNKLLLEDTKAPVLIIQSKSRETFSYYQGRIILIDQEWEEINTYSVENLNIPIGLQDLAYVIYTSGSTGVPKGVMVEHTSVVNYIRWFADYSGCQSQDRIDFSSSVIFDMMVTNSIASLALGLHIFICKDETKKDIKNYLSFIEKNKINIIKITPSFFVLMIEQVSHQTFDLSQLRIIILAGENLRSRECKSWLTFYPMHLLFNEYGPTETTVGIMQYKVTSHNIDRLGSNVPIGKPCFNIRCWIMNASGEEVAKGDSGELYIGGVALARGYLNQEKLTKEKFIQNNFDHHVNGRLYKTGDLCRYLPDGSLEYISRLDNQIKIRGFRIEPGEIEKYLLNDDRIKNVVVVPKEMPAHEEQLIAYYIPSHPSFLPSRQDLITFLQKRFPAYMIPSFFIHVNSFPLTQNGKLNIHALPLPTVEVDHFDQPKTKIEKMLHDIWANVFRLGTVGIHDDFFSLGGHSLLAARIVIKIEKCLGRKVELYDIYHSPTIKQLARVVERAKNTENNQVVLHSIYHGRLIPLGDFQFMFWVSHIFEPKTKKLNVIARRRLSGLLDRAALSYAFECILKRHEILSYRILKYIPAQYKQKNSAFHLVEKNIQHLTQTEKELELSASLDRLLSHYPWDNKSPLILAKIFYLEENIFELQVSVPHIIFDDASEEILFSDLSKYYFMYKNKEKLSVISGGDSYREYIRRERDYLYQYFERDMKFWDAYLSHATLLELPVSEIIYDMDAKKIPYSTYLEIPAAALDNLQKICIVSHVTLIDVFCAIMSFVLYQYSNQQDHILVNIIKSDRRDERFDETIGCLVGLDVLKIMVNHNLNIIGQAKEIQKSRMQIEKYQVCSSMAKLSCLNRTYHQHPIKNFLIKMISLLVSKVFFTLKLHPQLLIRYGRLSGVRTKQNFIVNLNVFNNFFIDHIHTQLLGCQMQEAPLHQYDLSIVDNVLDICFLRNPHSNKAYLVISGNLQPAFREKIGNDMIAMLLAGSL